MIMPTTQSSHADSGSVVELFLSLTLPAYEAHHSPLSLARRQESFARLGRRRFKRKDYIEDIDTKALSIYVDAPLSIEVAESPVESFCREAYPESSETVTPVLEDERYTDFSDTGKISDARSQFGNLYVLGVWPCTYVIRNPGSDVVNRLSTVIGITHQSTSVDACVQHIHEHGGDPHFVVVDIPVNVRHIKALIHPRVRKIFIYCDHPYVKDYQIASEQYPSIVVITDQQDVLVRQFLGDLATCITDIGEYYDKLQQTSRAHARYRHAYRLRITLRDELNTCMRKLKNPGLSN